MVLRRAIALVGVTTLLAAACGLTERDDGGVRDDEAPPGSENPSWTLETACASALAYGDGHACVLYEDGTVFCLGDNPFGQLGNGSEKSSWLVDTGLTNVTAIAAGGNHNCAIVNDGSVWCWGSNAAGQLGVP